MQRKSALVSADIQCLTARVLRRSRVIQPLVQKRAGLLPGSGIVGKAQAVQQEAGLQLRVVRVL